jgi:hypothetical protein
MFEGAFFSQHVTMNLLEVICVGQRLTDVEGMYLSPQTEG